MRLGQRSQALSRARSVHLCTLGPSQCREVTFTPSVWGNTLEIIIHEPLGFDFSRVRRRSFFLAEEVAKSRRRFPFSSTRRQCFFQRRMASASAVFFRSVRILTFSLSASVFCFVPFSISPYQTLQSPPIMVSVLGTFDARFQSCLGASWFNLARVVTPANRARPAAPYIKEISSQVPCGQRSARVQKDDQVGRPSWWMDGPSQSGVQ